MCASGGKVGWICIANSSAARAAYWDPASKEANTKPYPALLDMVAYAFNKTQEAEAEGNQTSLVYVASSRPAGLHGKTLSQIDS